MLEQLYTDFTTKLLPTIQQGLVITKDYFADLFGRYVKYLIVTDSILAGASLIGFLLVIGFIVYGWKKDWDSDLMIPVTMFGGAGAIFLAISFFVNSFDLVKDIYIPEVRVYEQVMEMKNTSSNH